jgi:hypothetical protein
MRNNPFAHTPHTVRWVNPPQKTQPPPPPTFPHTPPTHIHHTQSQAPPPPFWSRPSTSPSSTPSRLGRCIASRTFMRGGLSRACVRISFLVCMYISYGGGCCVGYVCVCVCLCVCVCVCNICICLCESVSVCIVRSVPNSFHSALSFVGMTCLPPSIASTLPPTSQTNLKKKIPPPPLFK